MTEPTLQQLADDLAKLTALLEAQAAPKPSLASRLKLNVSNPVLVRDILAFVTALGALVAALTGTQVGS